MGNATGSRIDRGRSHRLDFAVARRALACCPSIVAALLIYVTSDASAVDVLTSRNSIARNGVNADERVLTPANVNATSFGKLWTLYADGQIVAQPLYVSNLEVDTSTNPNAPRVQGTFNAVLIATMHNTVYLYDADRERAGPGGQNIPLWATWLGQPRPGGKDIDMWSTNDPEWGILSTPVIDPTKSVVYVVAWHDDGGPGGNLQYRLHALRLKDGVHLVPPVVLDAPALDRRKQKQRPGLLLTGGTLYIAFGGDGSRGVLLAHDAATLAQTAVWTVTPTGQNGGIWHAGQAPAADADGNIYLMTGNGTFDAHTGGADYGDSFVKLRLEGGTLVVRDYFTPCNERFLNSIDMDLGSSGPVLIPEAKLMFAGGKDGNLFLLSTAAMGKHVPPLQPGAATCANPNALQEFKAGRGHLHGSPVFWQRPTGPLVYLWTENDRLRAYRFVNRRFVQSATLGSFRPPDGMPGGMLSLSSRGSTNGILWAVVPLDGDANKQRGVKGIVLAIDAQDVTKVLWTSEQSGARDHLGLFAKYVPPTIAGGKVFVATYGDDEPRRIYGGAARPQTFPGRYQIVVYGPLAQPSVPVTDQSRDDVQLLRSRVDAGAVGIDLTRCRAMSGETRDCTEEFERVAGAPSLETVIVPSGDDLAGCQIVRVTTAAKGTALTNAQGIGFYAADVTAGQFSVNHGRLIRKGDLKAAGSAVLKSGDQASLHEFAAIVNCELAPGVVTGKQFKPYMEFVAGPPPAIFRNWDPIAGNYAIGAASTTVIDRSQELLR